jgi:putative drug exporter of the RND superfamily
VLVPEVMHTLGPRNWYLPSWLDRRLPHLEIEEGPSSRSAEHELALASSD